MPARPAPLQPRFDTEVLKEITDAWIAECGVRVQQKRKSLSMHRKQLADLSGTTEPTIIRIEAGTLTPRDHIRLAVAGAMCCEVADLWPYPSCSQINARAKAA